MVPCPTDGCQGILLNATIEEEDTNGKAVVRIQYEACVSLHKELHEKCKKVGSNIRTGCCNKSISSHQK